MIVLNTATRSLEYLLGGAITTNQLPFVVNYVNTTREGANHQNSANGISNSGTAVTVLAAPLAGEKRTVQSFSVYNADTVNATVTVRLNDNATIRKIVVVVLVTGDHLIYTSAAGWFVLTAEGFIKSVSTAVPTTVPNGGTGATTLTGLVVGNGTAAMTAFTSSTVGQIPRVTGANAYAFGALDLADTDAVTGTLPIGNGGTGLTTGSFPAGTRMLFHQTAAPTGWTKDTATANLNDSALRLTTGTVTPGGTVVFSTVFGTARATSATAPGSTDAAAPGSTDGFTLTTTEMPAHTHFFGGSDGGTTRATGATSDNDGFATSSTGGGGSHSHAHATTHVHTHATTHTHTSNLNVFYQDVIIAAKD